MMVDDKVLNRNLSEWFTQIIRRIARLFFHRQWEVVLSEVRHDLSVNADRLDQISHSLIVALIAGEDRKFLLHNGIDYKALARAFIRNLQARKFVEGGSTIEQQLIRTYTGDRRRTIDRKLRDILMASLLASAISKDAIARLYIFRAYYGWQANGIAQACKRFDFNLKQHSLSDACLIVARLKYPESQYPSFSREYKIQRRASYIIGNIYKDEYYHRLIHAERWAISEFPISF